MYYNNHHFMALWIYWDFCDIDIIDVDVIERKVKKRKEKNESSLEHKSDLIICASSFETIQLT